MWVAVDPLGTAGRVAPLPRVPMPTLGPGRPHACMPASRSIHPFLYTHWALEKRANTPYKCAASSHHLSVGAKPPENQLHSRATCLDRSEVQCCVQPDVGETALRLPLRHLVLFICLQLVQRLQHQGAHHRRRLLVALPAPSRRAFVALALRRLGQGAAQGRPEACHLLGRQHAAVHHRALAALCRVADGTVVGAARWGPGDGSRDGNGEAGGQRGQQLLLGEAGKAGAARAWSNGSAPPTNAPVCDKAPAIQAHQDQRKAAWYWLGVWHAGRCHQQAAAVLREERSALGAGHEAHRLCQAAKVGGRQPRPERRLNCVPAGSFLRLALAQTPLASGRRSVLTLLQADRWVENSALGYGGAGQ